MRCSLLQAALSALHLASLATASRPAGIPQRPDIKPWPYNTGQPMPLSPPRDEDRYCHVTAPCHPREDSAPRILKAFEECNDGGTVVLDQVYLISSPLDLTFLQHVDVVITGEVHFDDSDVYYWAENSFKLPFQNMSAFWLVGGEDVNIYGDLSNDASVLDGHGQAYWEEIETNKTVSNTQRQGMPTDFTSFSGQCFSLWKA
jgi:galacturan 1,4-alpha-galacturonidase